MEFDAGAMPQETWRYHERVTDNNRAGMDARVEPRSDFRGRYGFYTYVADNMHHFSEP